MSDLTEKLREAIEVELCICDPAGKLRQYHIPQCPGKRTAAVLAALAPIIAEAQRDTERLREHVELMRPAYEDRQTYIGRARANYRRLSARTPEAGDGE